MVVPTLAPMTTPTAWVRFMSPALTKPTKVTVVAEEDCTTAVTRAPVRHPMTRLVADRLQKGAQTVAGHLLQPLGHEFHAEKEKAQPTESLDYYGGETHCPTGSLVCGRDTTI